MKELNQAQKIWQKANAVCFDVDSTLIQEEAIDELANFCGKGEEVEMLTAQAMKGGMDFREALALRLAIIRPTLGQLKEFILTQTPRLTPHVKELIYELQKRGKEIFLISGGFYSIIVPIAEQLNIPLDNIYANKLRFFYDGSYAGFDETQPTSRSGGKAAAVNDIKARKGHETVIMIGDGITDWEASPPANLFIGFGGNVYRPEVKNRAEWYVKDFRDLIEELLPMPVDSNNNNAEENSNNKETSSRKISVASKTSKVVASTSVAEIPTDNHNLVIINHNNE